MPCSSLASAQGLYHRYGLIDVCCAAKVNGTVERDSVKVTSSCYEPESASPSGFIDKGDDPSRI
jgi:hypothetical protein